MNRKSFLKTSILGTATSAFIPGAVSAVEKKHEPELPLLRKIKSGDKLPDNETYWKLVAEYFNRPTDFINLEHGYFSHQPSYTYFRHQKFANDINTQTSHFMRVDQNDKLAESKQALSAFLGVPSDELVITRNTTESLNIVIQGFKWEKGDEVIIGDQDYGSMVEAFQQASKRFGIEIKVAKVPLLPQSDEEITQAYLSLVSPKTKMIHLTHTINLTGQVLPLRMILDEVRMKNIVSVVDAAHSTAHVLEPVGSLNADIVGGSLHKWLCTPLGVGYLTVKKHLIEKIWPLMGDSSLPETDIRKFEHQGTRPIQSIMSIIPAIEFHMAIGFVPKLERLRYLKELWLKETDGTIVQCISPWKEPHRSGAIATFQKTGLSPTEISKKLMQDHKIFTVAIEHPVVKGVRVTPHLSTHVEDIHRFIEALKKI